MKKMLKRERDLCEKEKERSEKHTTLVMCRCHYGEVAFYRLTTKKIEGNRSVEAGTQNIKKEPTKHHL
jgi:hypothetical protein